jgi:K+-sensing histidine kinase KdpD
MKFTREAITWRPAATYPVAASVVGSLAALGVGLALIPFRETLGSVNVALVMAALIVLSAEFGGRTAGVIVGVVGSLVFNVFHTMPYYALVIDRADEAVAAIVLIALGLLIGSWHRKTEP